MGLSLVSKAAIVGPVAAGGAGGPVVEGVGEGAMTVALAMGLS